MIRPEQIANAKFTPVSTGTYSAEEVDAFLKLVSEAYGETLKEKDVLIKKISILAEKVESYRSDEEALKLALLDAHKMALSVTKEAEEKAAALVSEAEASAKSTTENAEKSAAELSDTARLQAGDIVNNARTAVASLKERAQQEADKTVADAKAEAEVIIAKANKEHDSIVGNSKGEYEFYLSELEKVKGEIAKFKSLFEGFNVGDGYVAKAFVPAEPETVEEPVCEETEEAPAEAEEPVVEAVEEIEEAAEEIIEAEVVEEEPAAEEEPEELVELDIPVFELDDEDDGLNIPCFDKPEAVEEPAAEVVEEEIPAADDDLDDLFGLFEDDEADVNLPEDLASDIDDILPEPSVPDFSSADEEEDLFASLEEVKDDDNETGADDDITSLFDSLFDE